MGNKKKNSWLSSIIIALIIISLPSAFMYIKSLGDSTDVGKVRRKIKKYLHKKYGEEFMVDRIGMRSDDEGKDYVARIYPKSIIETNKEGDQYYYGGASVDKLSFGRLGEVGDSYSYVSRNIDMEKYLLPNIKKIFGERVLLKVDVQHKVTGDGSWWAGYKSKSLDEMKEKVKSDPEHNRIELDLQVYIFNRIENKAEKEKRQRQIFDFVQYLKNEGLYEYLELGVIFIDERVLVPSYGEFRSKIYKSDEVVVEVEGEEIYMPPMELRKKMSKELQEEIDKMSEENLLASMRKINKEDLTYDGINKYNAQYIFRVYSEGRIKTRYSSWLRKGYKLKNYESIKDIKSERVLDYIYMN